MAFADKPITRRNALKEGAKIVTLGLLGGMLASGAGGGVSRGQTDDLYVRKFPPDITQTILVPGTGPGLTIRLPDDDQTKFFLDLLGANNLFGFRFRGGLMGCIINDSVLNAAVLMTLFYTSGGLTNPVGNALTVLTDINSPSPNSHRGDISVGDDAGGFGLILNYQTFNTEPGKGGLVINGPVNQGADVGLPTGDPGGLTFDMNYGDHRHAFTGRFAEGGFLATAVLAGLPSKFKRFKIANNFTVRRISVYALAGPTGGTESFGIVNAAGTLQGTAVVLPAGPAAKEAEAAQTTNLTGGTIYYLAETASAVGVTVPAANVSIDVEYTMNV